jgi:P27 family predicted phage terminase small subunit
MTGRKPKPQALRIAQAAAGHTAAKIPVVEAPAGEPERPDYLTDESAAVWTRTCDALRSMGTLSPADVDTIAAFVQAVADLRWAVATMATEGRMTEGASGMKRKHPAVGIAHDAALRIRSLGSDLGLNPTARQRITVKPKDDIDEFKKFLAAR